MATLESWQEALRPQRVIVSLPRFELNPKNPLALGKELRDLGLTAPFMIDKADFTLIGNPADPKERSHIDEAIHKVFIKVDEKGTEAAAATALVGKGGGPPPASPFEVKVDRPFHFFILDKASGLVLFMGRVTEP